MKTEPWLNAYGEPYDPRPAIEAWKAGEVHDASQELWDNLYHQGALNSASYAAVGEIAGMMLGQAAPDWNAYSLIATIEEARLAEGNPPIPSELESDCRAAWASLLPLALRDLREVQDDLTVRGILAVIAHAKGQRTIAIIALCTEDERLEMLNA